MPETLAIREHGTEIKRMARQVADRYGIPNLLPDLEQEGLYALVKLIRAHGKFGYWNEYGRLKVYNAIRDVARKEFRRGIVKETGERRKTELLDEHVSLLPSPSDRMDVTEALVKVATLPEPVRSVVVWAAVGEPQAAIAEALGLDQSRVSRLLKRGYDLLHPAPEPLAA